MSDDTPTWALRELDLATLDEDEVCARIDDVIDSEFAFVVFDSRESNDPKAVMLPWSAYVGLVSRALPKADQIERKVDAEVARDIQGDILR